MKKHKQEPVSKQEPVGEAYLCDACHTPFDGAYECPSCGHNEATKEPVYISPPQRHLIDRLVVDEYGDSGIGVEFCIDRPEEKLCVGQLVYTKQPQRQPLTDAEAHQTLLDMAAHIDAFGDNSTTEQQLSAECVRFILERAAPPQRYVAEPHKPLTHEEYKQIRHCMIAVRDWMAEGCDTTDIPRPHIATLVAHLATLQESK